MRSRLVPLVAIAIVLLAGIWFAVVQRDRGNDAQPLESPTESPVTTGSAAEEPGVITDSRAAVPEQVQTLVGRWRRPDGGYIMEISGVDEDGKLKVAYFNPRPINVSRAEFAGSGDSLAVFVELRDTGYPGATYRLLYDKDRDMLVGLYYQPTVKQTFDVVFVRLR